MDKCAFQIHINILNAHLEGYLCPSSVIHRLVPFQGGEARKRFAQMGMSKCL
jgi:hypothetical protein